MDQRKANFGCVIGCRQLVDIRTNGFIAITFPVVGAVDVDSDLLQRLFASYCTD